MEMESESAAVGREVLEEMGRTRGARSLNLISSLSQEWRLVLRLNSLRGTKGLKSASVRVDVCAKSLQ